jgi:hypothetical protein
MALAKALGHGNDIAQQWLGKEAREAGSNDEALGEAAASRGEALPDHPVAHGFAVGYSKIQTQQTAFRAAQEAQAFAAQNKTMPLDQYTDENGQPQPGLLRQIDAIYQKHLGGLEKDPEAARAMAPILTHTINEIAGQRNLEVIKDTQEQAQDLQTSKLGYDIQHGTRFFNRDEALADLQKVYGNDKRGALSALVHTVGEGAVTGGNPAVIRTLLPKDTDFGGGVRLTPQDQMYLDNAEARATEAQARAWHTQNKQTMSDLTAQALQGKDIMAGVMNYLKQPGADSSEARALIDWVYKKGKEGEADSEENNKTGWDLMGGVNDGSITTPSQAMKFLADRGLAGTKIGNNLATKAIMQLRNVDGLDHNDPDYQASRGNIAELYKPGTNLLGKINNPAAQAQQAGVLADYNTEFVSQIRQGKSATEAARVASKNAQEKWGPPIEGPNGQMKSANKRMPTTDAARVQVIRDVMAGHATPQDFYGSGITSNDLNVMYSVGLITPEEMETGARLIMAKHKR